MKKAVAYYRTSSATNVGADKDSRERQERAVNDYAARNELEIVASYYDAAVSGADPLDRREGFRQLLQHIASNGVRTVLVETANRFARDLIVQETGWKKLQALGIELIAVDSPNAFVDDTPTAILIRQILGAVAEFDKAMTVAKLSAARERKRAATGKCEGQKGWAEIDPAMAKLARQLRVDKGMSLDAVSRELAKRGHRAKSGKHFTRTVVSRMVSRAGVEP